MTNHTLQKTMFQTGCAFAGITVVLGAFGAHTLKEIIAPEELSIFETGVRYQLIHSLAIILLSISLRKLHEKVASQVFFLFVFGIIIFSFSLYVLSLRSLLFDNAESARWIGAITPIGGLCLIVAWFYLAISGYKIDDGIRPEKRPSTKRKRRDENQSE